MISDFNMINDTSLLIENFFIKSENDNNNNKRRNSSNTGTNNLNQIFNCNSNFHECNLNFNNSCTANQDADNDIIWIFENYNEQKIDTNTFIDLTSDDIDLLLDSNNLELFNNITSSNSNTNSFNNNNSSKTQNSTTLVSSVQVAESVFEQRESSDSHNLLQVIDSNNIDMLNELNEKAEIKNETEFLTATRNSGVKSASSTSIIEYKCLFCNKLFKKLFNYKRHLLIHNNEYPYKCDFCERKFNDQSNYKKHLKLCFNSNENKKLTCSQLLLSSEAHFDNCSDIQVKLNKYKCEICDKMFYKNFNYKRHLNMHKLNMMNNESSSLNTLTISNDDKSIFNDLNAHYYECKICNKKFNELKQLKLHDLNIHTKLLKKIKCDECKNQFETKYSYITHKKNCLTKNLLNDGGNDRKFNEYLLSCNNCKKKFNKIYNLNRHLASNKNCYNWHQQNCVKNDPDNPNENINENLIKKYECKYCSKLFYENNKLKLHIKKHHSERIK